MAKVELIHAGDCPNVQGARLQLSSAFAELGLAPDWVEWNRDDPSAPAYVRDYGSPTILVNGKDVAGTTPSEDISCCRKNGARMKFFYRLQRLRLPSTNSRLL